MDSGAMNLIAFLVAIVCTSILIHFNFFLMGMGIIITIKGIIFESSAAELSHEAGPPPALLEYYTQVALTYTLPGCVMMTVGFVGYHGTAKFKTCYLAAYSGLLIAMIGAKTIRPDISLFAYFNRITSYKGEFDLFTDIIYPEYGMQIVLLISTLYLIYYDYHLKKIEKQIRLLDVTIKCIKRYLYL